MTFLLRDQFEEFLETIVGDDVHIHRDANSFSVEYLGKKKRQRPVDKDDAGRQ